MGMKQSLKKRSFSYYIFSYLFNFFIILFLIWLDWFLFKRIGILLTNLESIKNIDFHVLVESSAKFQVETGNLNKKV